jgi:hypothetical protein
MALIRPYPRKLRRNIMSHPEDLFGKLARFSRQTSMKATFKARV